MYIHLIDTDTDIGRLMLPLNWSFAHNPDVGASRDCGKYGSPPLLGTSASVQDLTPRFSTSTASFPRSPRKSHGPHENPRSLNFCLEGLGFGGLGFRGLGV